MFPQRSRGLPSYRLRATGAAPIVVITGRPNVGKSTLSTGWLDGGTPSFRYAGVTRAR